MLFGNIFSDSICAFSRQLKFYPWPYKHDLDPKERQELLKLLEECHFQKLANKIKSLQKVIKDSRQQIGKLLIDHCYPGDRKHQLIQLIKADIIDINVMLDNYGRTLLHRSAYNLDVELIQILVEHNVNLRICDYAGNTALHIAIQSYRNGALIYDNEAGVMQNLTDIMRLLLDADKKNDLARRQESYSDNRCKRPRLEGDLVGESELQFPYQFATNNELSYDSALAEKTARSRLREDKSSVDYATYQAKIEMSEKTLCRLFLNPNKCRLHCEKRQEACMRDQVGISTSIDQVGILHSHTNSVTPPKTTNSIKSTTSSTFEKMYRSGLKQASSVSLVDMKNAFGRTSLHYCVLVVGEQYLDHFVKLILEYEPDIDAVDYRLKTALYCLIKRPGIVRIRPKCRAIELLLSKNCDDLGLAIEPSREFSEKSLAKIEQKLASRSRRSSKEDNLAEPIFSSKGFRRVPKLMHLTRLALVKYNDEKNGKTKRQAFFMLPDTAPFTLNYYINRKILDQSELF